MIKLPTHDRSNNYLEDLGNNKYKLHAQYGDYCRFIYNDDNTTYYAVDPPGGPFMTVGEFKIDGKVLKSISIDQSGVILTFE
nr:MAG TPA: hypothetical protein [Bacteriophage sp.]